MSDYPAGSAKLDPATGSIAVRTVFPEEGQLIPHAWQVATVGSGGHTRSSAEVETWLDVELPEPPDLAQLIKFPST